MPAHCRQVAANQRRLLIGELTAARIANTMRVMHASNNTRSRPTAWAVMIALAAAVFADCVPAEASSTAEHACCIAMKHDCGPKVESQQCCSTDSPSVSDFRITKQVPLQPPVATVSLPVAADLLLRDGSSLLAFHHLGPVKPPGVPKYVLTAAFRV